MKIEDKEKFIDIFEGNAKTALEIFLIAGVEVGRSNLVSFP